MGTISRVQSISLRLALALAQPDQEANEVIQERDKHKVQGGQAALNQRFSDANPLFGNPKPVLAT